MMMMMMMMIDDDDDDDDDYDGAKALIGTGRYGNVLWHLSSANEVNLICPDHFSITFVKALGPSALYLKIKVMYYC